MNHQFNRHSQLQSSISNPSIGNPQSPIQSAIGTRQSAVDVAYFFFLVAAAAGFKTIGIRLTATPSVGVPPYDILRDGPVLRETLRRLADTGVSVLDTESGRRIRYRADERFAMCSTFKLLLAAASNHDPTVKEAEAFEGGADATNPESKTISIGTVPSHHSDCPLGDDAIGGEAKDDPATVPNVPSVFGESRRPGEIPKTFKVLEFGNW